MKVIAVVNEKGGVGKSTISWNLSVAAALDGKKVLLVDADTQGSTINSRGMREDSLISAVQITKRTLYKDIQGFTDFDYIFIDAGGKDTDVLRAAIMASSLGILLVPVQPSVYDMWATEETFEIIKQQRAFLDIDAYVLLNQVISNTTIAKDTKESLAALAEEKEVKVVNAKLHSLLDYKKCVSKGQGVIEYNPKGKAAQEIRDLYAEIKQYLKED